jgi:hypothetical protein
VGAGAQLGTPNSFSLPVSAPVATQPGCTTTANVNADIRSRGRVTFTLGGGQVAAVKFYDPGDGKRSGALSITDMIGAPPPPDVQVNISTCPGDTNVTNYSCGFYTPGYSATNEYGPASPYLPFWQCPIDTTKTYYYNVRFPSCSGTCGVGIDWY